MNLKDRIKQAMEKDETEMQGIYVAVADGLHPDAAAALIVGGDFRLSESVQTELKVDAVSSVMAHG